MIKKKYESKQLFSFFKNRIPDKNDNNIEKILKKYNMDSYDEMILLSKTKGELYTDRYYMQKD